jgi:hypothetical protein
MILDQQASQPATPVSEKFCSVFLSRLTLTSHFAVGRIDITQDMAFNLSRNSMGWVWVGGAKLFVCWCFNKTPHRDSRPFLVLASQAWACTDQLHHPKNTKTSELSELTSFAVVGQFSLMEYDHFIYCWELFEISASVLIYKPASALKFQCAISKRATHWDWDAHSIFLFAKEIPEKMGEIDTDYSI